MTIEMPCIDLHPPTSPAALQALESAAFAAWPAMSVDDFGGWRLQFDRGYTKRANSLNATDRSRLLTDAEIDAIEGRFRERSLTPVFRLTSFSPVPQADAQLAQRGYLFLDESKVMTCTLSDSDVVCPLEPDLGHWLASFKTVSGQSGDHLAVHLDILQRIVHPSAYAVLKQAGSPVCCGLGVLVGERVGVFDVATRPDHWGQGLAATLCRGILAWGRQRGARTAFLQVAASNTAAVRLYEKLGFKVAYSYWYREGSR